MQLLQQLILTVTVGNSSVHNFDPVIRAVLLQLTKVCKFALPFFNYRIFFTLCHAMSYLQLYQAQGRVSVLIGNLAWICSTAVTANFKDVSSTLPRAALTVIDFGSNSQTFQSSFTQTHVNSRTPQPTHSQEICTNQRCVRSTLGGSQFHRAPGACLYSERVYRFVPVSTN